MGMVESYWRDAKPEDAVRVVPLRARFRCDEAMNWTTDDLVLIGYCGVTRVKWAHLDGPWLDTDGDGWLFCQVYDAPDPGEGWRLVDTEVEERHYRDEQWYPALGKWLCTPDCFEKDFESGCFYRRSLMVGAVDPGDGWRLVEVRIEMPKRGDECYVEAIEDWVMCNEFLSPGLCYATDAVVRRRVCEVLQDRQVRASDSSFGERLDALRVQVGLITGAIDLLREAVDRLDGKIDSLMFD